MGHRARSQVAPCQDTADTKGAAPDQEGCRYCGQTDPCAFSTEKANVGKTAGSAVFGGMFGRKALGSSNASVQDNLRRKETSELAPYESLWSNIDSILVQLDTAQL